ncbi:hypothetical protein [Novosphingobium colocasiae]|uniref:hypothetical protein n=1 Tax=Novosphingobium colocasiae TaxID=1256513 RepID=UPI0035B4979E
MFGLFRRARAVDPPSAASALAMHGARKRADADREKRRDMANRIRADLRAKGKDMPPIDWSAL